MVLYGITPEVIKPTALLLNVFVSSVAFLQFYRGGHFSWKNFFPFAIASIPMSFVGGMLLLDGTIYKRILGFLLLFPIVRFFFFDNTADDEIRPANFYLSLVIGGTIGLLSGMIGIGGGIILSPVLLLLKWANQKQAAAISALFILVNSLSGLAGQVAKGISFNATMYQYVLIAFVGGLCGAYFGALKLQQKALKNLLAFVLLIASFKLIFP
jgi:uncharacterized membrane protein YfcA